MNITREEAVAKIESWKAVSAKVQLFVRDIHGTGYRHEIAIGETSLEFVTLDLGLGDFIRITFTNAHFASYSLPEQPPPQLMTLPPTVPFILVVTKGILNFVLYEVAG